MLLLPPYPLCSFNTRSLFLMCGLSVESYGQEGMVCCVAKYYTCIQCTASFRSYQLAKGLLRCHHTVIQEAPGQEAIFSFACYYLTVFPTQLCPILIFNHQPLKPYRLSHSKISLKIHSLNFHTYSLNFFHASTKFYHT